MRLFSSLLLAAALIPCVASPVLAQDRHDPRGDRPAAMQDRHNPRGDRRGHEAVRRQDGRRWHGDIHRFHDQDFDYWRTGYWKRSAHEGRNGWWWIVGGSWYFYPAPVYPYPDPYIPPDVVVELVPGGALPAYYYCSNPEGYYPYVPACAAPWQQVAAQTVVAPPPAPAPMQSQREIDYRQLNTYADEFYHVNFRQPSAKAKLKKLGKNVEDFRRSLLERDYNAMDVLKDTEDLGARISAQRAALTKGKASPASLPPGSKVVFPPQ